MWPPIVYLRKKFSFRIPLHISPSTVEEELLEVEVDGGGENGRLLTKERQSGVSGPGLVPVETNGV